MTQPEPAAPIAEITRTDCKRCGTEVHGLNGRYACHVCEWVNEWSEGHDALPSDDQPR